LICTICHLLIDSFLSSLRRQSTGTVSDAGSFRPIEISPNKPSSFATQQQKQHHQQQQQFQLNSSTSKYSSTMQQHQQQQQQTQPALLQSTSQQLKPQQIQHQQQIQKNQHTKQKMEWNNSHDQSITNSTSVNIAAPVPVNGQLVDLSLVEATSPVWYRLKISRQEAISILKNQPTGSFLVRDSTTFKDAYGLAVKSSKPPNKPGQKSGFAKFMKNILKFTALFPHVDDISNDLVRHYLIETVTTPTRGVRIKGFSAEQVFPNLLALIQYHTQYPVALPCCLVLPPIPSIQTSAVVTNTASNSSLRNGNGNTNGDSDSITLVQNNGIRSLNQTPTSFNGNISTVAVSAMPATRGESLDTPNPSRSITSPLSPTAGMFHSELISPPPNISCRCLYLGAVEVDSNQPEQANLMAAVDTLIPGPILQAATCDQLGAESPIQYAECQLQAAHNEGILLTDLSRKLFFQRHFSANSFIYAGIDHRDKAFLHPNHSALGIDKPKLFGLIIKKLSGEYMAHIFSEFDANYGAAIVTAQINSLLLNK
uniref:SH2 domain-containing protein n=1 Tax=Rodentolepis nana TaxID=102285 RepID=A0A0R3U067_RODNA